ncbi:phytanoyl-CoA dioxygenase family protein [Bradyrhizobium sp. Cp5.3]|uniref:phytanoyl-CoA dioxygenase family protein n=1 Tax=Bradyrhizobium sp. Cp5.3 TaxID=443598 RepID=UPI0018DC7B2C|nr:phytanoyl-CoA dioxygenase family protein [Bradyrhizobium sp. Cp5.3]
MKADLSRCTSLDLENKRASFDKDGFVKFAGLVENAQELREHILAIEAAEPQVDGPWLYFESSGKDASPLINRIENFADHDDVLGDCVRSSLMAGITTQLLGEPVCLFKEKINLKLPGGAGFELHQDQQAGWSRYASLFVTALIAIDAADTSNGCLEVFPGLHKDGLLGPEGSPLPISAVGNRAPIPVELSPGDVLFFDSYAPHASKPNLSDRPRRAMYLTYNRLRDGDHREDYYLHKWDTYPPDIARRKDRTYAYRV